MKKKFTCVKCKSIDFKIKVHTHDSATFNVDINSPGDYDIYDSIDEVCEETEDFGVFECWECGQRFYLETLLPVPDDLEIDFTPAQVKLEKELDNIKMCIRSLISWLKVKSEYEDVCVPIVEELEEILK